MRDAKGYEIGGWTPSFIYHMSHFLVSVSFRGIERFGLLLTAALRPQSVEFQGWMFSRAGFVFGALGYFQYDSSYNTHTSGIVVLQENPFTNVTKAYFWKKMLPTFSESINIYSCRNDDAWILIKLLACATHSARKTFFYPSQGKLGTSASKH